METKSTHVLQIALKCILRACSTASRGYTSIKFLYCFVFATAFHIIRYRINYCHNFTLLSGPYRLSFHCAGCWLYSLQQAQWESRLWRREDLKSYKQFSYDIYPLRVKPGHRNVLHAPTRYTSFEAGKHRQNHVIQHFAVLEAC